MVSVNYGLIKESDWISGTSPHDEKFMGYVQSMNEDGTMKVFVTQCDRETKVGTTIEAKLGKVKKLPEYTPSAADELHSLIELALITHDKEWFDALSAKLSTPSAQEVVRPINTILTNMRGSRL